MGKDRHHRHRRHDCDCDDVFLQNKMMAKYRLGVMFGVLAILIAIMAMFDNVNWNS